LKAAISDALAIDSPARPVAAGAWTRDQPLASRRNDLGREVFELLPVEDSALRRGWLAFGARQSRLCQWYVPIEAPPGPDPSNRASVPHHTTWTDIGKATGRFSERRTHYRDRRRHRSDWPRTPARKAAFHPKPWRQALGRMLLQTRRVLVKHSEFSEGATKFWRMHRLRGARRRRPVGSKAPF
jgi:hypothetical protein